MTRMHRREKHQFVFAAVVATVGLVAVLFFLIVFLPLRSEYQASGASITRLQNESRERAVILSELELNVDRVAQASQDRTRFLGSRLIPRDDGFAAMITDLERLAQIAGINRDRVNYSTSETGEFGVHAVVINMPVRSGYSGLTRFIQELEDADTFFILDSIEMSRTQSDEEGDLNLMLNLTTFFSQEQ